MKNIVFSLLFLMLSAAVAAQDGSGKPQVPEITLPSPEAYALTKYGDIPINEFTGMVSANIPLYTLKSGKISVPVSLNYSGAGVKVNQTATWTGINWTLSAGGVITRTINDAPDEKETIQGRLSAAMIQSMNIVYGSADTETLNKMCFEFRKEWDFKPDMFNFSFPGYSGSFYLDENFIPRVSKLDSNIKVEIVGPEADLKTRFRNHAAFCITTADGVKYYFGGDGATENSFTGTHKENPNAPTGFYLTQIVHPDNGVVYFDYTTSVTGKTVTLSRTETVSKITYEEDALGCTAPAVNTSLVAGITQNTVFNGKTLSKIRAGNNYTEVVFNVANGSTGQYANILNSIEVKEGTTLLHKVNLTYLFPKAPTTSHRFFLTKVEFNKDKNYGTGRKYEQYTLEYNDPTVLPDRLSYAQDLAGYYNGVNSNTMVLPKNNDDNWKYYSSALADRNSSFGYAQKGSLKKITYPTGGYTEFEYEPRYAKEYEKQIISMNIWRNDPGRTPKSKTTASNSILGNSIVNPDGSFGFSGAFIDEQIKVDITLTANAQMGHTDRTYIKLTDNTTNTSETKFVVMPDGSQEIGTGNFSYSTSLTFPILKGHVYKLELYNTYVSLVKFDASAAFSYTSNFKQIEDGGIRVKRAVDYTAATQNAFVKRFYYMPAKDLSKDIFELIPFKTNYLDAVTNHVVLKCCSGTGAILFPKEVNFSTFASSMPNLDVFDQKYEYVTISYGGDNFELGGKEKHFHNQDMSSQQDINPFYNSPFQQERSTYKGNLESVYNGTLLGEAELIKRKDVLYKTNEQSFTYRYDNVYTYGGTTGGLAFAVCENRLKTVQNLDIGIYNLYSRKAELIKKESKNFIESIPITTGGVNEANYKTVASTQEYQYSLLPGLPLAVKTATSDDTVFTEVRNVYADQPNLLTGLTAAQISACNKLVALNKVSTPVQVKTFRYADNNALPVLMGTQRTLFKSWNNNPNLILPEIIQASKGSEALVDRVVIEEYDTHANMTLAAMVNGPKTKYTYNQLDQVMIKIENYIAPSSGGGGDTFPEPDPAAPCTLHQTYPESVISWYQYDPVTHLVTQSINNNCRKTTYEYDALLRLKRIKDHDGNVIEEYDTNYVTN